MSTTSNGNGKKKKTGKEIAVIVFSIFIAIAMMVPSIGYIVSYYKYQHQPQAAQQEQNLTPEQINQSFADIIKQYNELIEKEPKNASLYVELGNAYVQWARFSIYTPNNEQTQTPEFNERLNKAIEAYDASLAIETNESAIIGKSLALVMLNKTDEAKSVLEGYLKDHPESTAAYGMLAHIFEAQGDNQKAIETYNKVKETTSDDNVKKQAQEEIDRIQGDKKSDEGSQQGSK